MGKRNPGSRFKFQAPQRSRGCRARFLNPGSATKGLHDVSLSDLEVAAEVQVSTPEAHQSGEVAVVVGENVSLQPGLTILFTHWPGTGILGSPYPANLIKPLNTEVRLPKLSLPVTVLAEYYHDLDKDAKSRIAEVRLP